MRIPRALSALAALVAVPLLAAAAPPPGTPSGPPPTSPATVVSEAQVVGPGTSLTGSATATLTVGVHLTSTAPVKSTLSVGSDHAILCPCVVIRADRTLDPLSPPIRVVTLHLDLGTDRDGHWTGTTNVLAADAGRWHIDAIGAGDRYALDSAGYPAPAPAAAVLGGTPPSTVVHGGQWTRVQVSAVRPAGTRTSAGRRQYAYRITGTATTAYGTPAAGAVLYLSSECPGHLGLPFWRARARADGGFGAVVWFVRPPSSVCAELAPSAWTGVTPGMVDAVPLRLPRPTLAVSAHVVRRGGRVTLTSTGFASSAKPVLQRWDGRDWVDVRTASRRGRAVIAVTTPPKGTSAYQFTWRGRTTPSVLLTAR
ncbi:hypothetical protein EV189_2650 [Motilibacter rhizosphaerae]|uniref:Uncharacterized protein n=1 Tax=Motilibacter rhizosphaerae TaxID=598652 RepID=A0A4Q7NPJ2_9ACTN|nr:hypothetical protein [Motilibacter rhizosphaerae]RZS87225.1 hypothetical protein EV189_2650 [Motilibacter rhizosphaerae]